MEEGKESQSRSRLHQSKASKLPRIFTVKTPHVICLVSVAAATLLGISSFRFAPPKPTVVPAPSASPLPKLPANLTELLAMSHDRLAACDVALMNLLCAEGLRGAENLNVAAGLSTLDHWAHRVDFETRRHLYRFQKNPAEFDHSEAKFRMLMLGVTLQTNFAVRYNPDRITPAGVFEPNDVFFADSRDVLLHGLTGERRMGTCSSLPVLYIAVGRRLGYPLKLVKTKSHLLARWDTASERFNIEASGRGVGWYDDDHFKRWPVPVSEAEIAAMGLLQSMAPAQELASFLSIRGFCLRASERAEDGIACLEHALRLDPDSQEQRLLLASARRAFAERGGPFEGAFDHPELYPDAAFLPRPPSMEALPFPRPGFNRGPAPPNLFHPTIPQLRIPNPYQQGGP